MPAETGRAARDHTSDRLSAALAPVVAAAGLDLEEVSVTPAGRRSVVRVVVDGDAGVDLDAVAEVSREVAAVLDEQDLVAGAYVLEVTSPGVDRPLTQPRHWRRAAGRLVEVTVDGATLTGRVVAADDDGVQLSGSDEPRRVAWSQLGPGRVQVEFNRTSDEQEGE